jgi:hypothetical protein
MTAENSQIIADLSIHGGNAVIEALRRVQAIAEVVEAGSADDVLLCAAQHLLAMVAVRWLPYVHDELAPVSSHPHELSFGELRPEQLLAAAIFAARAALDGETAGKECLRDVYALQRARRL